MSAYVVHDNTINRIVTFMLECDDTIDHNPLRSLSIQKTADLQTVAGAERLGKKMFALNVKAVKGCYPDKPDMIPSSYVFDKSSVTMMQAIKSMSCYMYQCNEDDCQQDPLYKRLVEFHNELTHHVVQSSKEWDKAEWG
jgi:hypothetical protein